jgi:hypothetical protein
LGGLSNRAQNGLILGGGALSLGVIWGVSKLWGEIWHCPFKMATGLPCPGCGGLRAFELLTQGDFIGALWTNPLSVLLVAFFAVSAVWIALDIVWDKRSWFDFIRRPWTKTATVCAIAVLCLNWVWNICKEL